MKSFITIILTLFIAVTFVNNSVAQCDDTQVLLEIDNPSFEVWESEGNYEDPPEGFWDTTNKIIDLNIFGSPNVTKDEDAHTGNYSAKLVTSSNLGTLTSASLFSGEFEPSITDPLSSAQFGKPFTETPDFFRVWYQYEPIEGDSAEIYCYLEKGANNETRVATAYALITEATTEWTELVLPFDYAGSTETPESITLVFASSAGGDLFQGQIGNTLYVDDVELVKCTTPTEDLTLETFSVEVFPNPAVGGNVKFEFSEQTDAVLNIFSVDGKKVFTANMNNDNYDLDIADWNNGFYQYVINDKNSNEAISRGSFVVQ